MMQLTFKRYEIKYQLSEEQCARLMQAMAPYMVPDAWGPSTVMNVYYDTPTNLLIRRSIEKPLYKEKVRIRSYGPLRPGQPVFLELKKKSEGVVYKRRAEMSAAERRKLRCERISLSCGMEEISGITRVVFTAKHEKNGSEVTKEHSFFWDAKENIIIKKPGKNIKKAKRRT